MNGWSEFGKALGEASKDGLRSIRKYIKREGDRWCVYDESGKKLGSYASKEEAEMSLKKYSDDQPRSEDGKWSGGGGGGGGGGKDPAKDTMDGIANIGSGATPKALRNARDLVANAAKNIDHSERLAGKAETNLDFVLARSRLTSAHEEIYRALDRGKVKDDVEGGRLAQEVADAESTLDTWVGRSTASGKDGHDYPDKAKAGLKAMATALRRFQAYADKKLGRVKSIDARIEGDNVVIKYSDDQPRAEDGKWSGGGGGGGGGGRTTPTGPPKAVITDKASFKIASAQNEKFGNMVGKEIQSLSAKVDRLSSDDVGSNLKGVEAIEDLQARAEDLIEAAAEASEEARADVYEDEFFGSAQRNMRSSNRYLLQAAKVVDRIKEKLTRITGDKRQ